MFNFLSESENKVISAQLVKDSNQGKPQTDFLAAMIAEFDNSQKRKTMFVAQRYYENENAITEAKRMVIGRDAESGEAVLMESKVLANNKLCHNFMKKLTRQKIGYLISKPFTLTATKKDDAPAEAFFTECKSYFDPAFFKKLKNVARDSIVKGIGWLHPYYDEKGNLKFLRISSEEGIPLWADSDHTVLDAFIRKYVVEEYTDGKKKEVKYVDYYTQEGEYHYYYTDAGKLMPISEDSTQFLTANFMVKQVDNEGKEQTTGINWGKIPFIPFKYDPDEQSLLVRVKSLIDDYDKKTSGASNTIDDFPNSLLVVKNYDGASKEEFVHNKNQYRTIFVQGDGDCNALETPLNISEVEIHIERLRQDIYEFGQGVDTANKDIRDTSGVAMRFLYADLDSDCLDWGAELTWSIKEICWFIQQDILAKGGTDYTAVEYDIVYNKEVIVNETETIANCAQSNGIISPQTIAARHPWTVDAKKEIDELNAQTETNLELEYEYSKPPASGGAQ